MTPPNPYSQLTSDAGRALLAGLAAFSEERLTDAAAYARAHAEPDVAAAALATAFARRRAAAAGKFSHAGDMFFTRTGYEQATSEDVARHRASRFANRRNVADLCCGIGGDALALARTAQAVMAIDIDADALACARANADALGVGQRVGVLQADALAADLSGYDAAFVDPSRRQAGARVRGGHRYAPPLEAVLARAVELPGKCLAVKVAPGLAFEDPGVRRALGPAPLEIELVSERGTCKEAVLWCGDLARSDGARRATVIDAAGAHVLEGNPSDQAAVRDFGAFLGEPDPAVIRAGLIAAACGCASVGDAASVAGPLDQRVAYLASDAPIATPFVRWYSLQEAMPFNVKGVRARLRALDIGHIVIKTRAFPLAPDEINALLKPEGSGHAILICTTVREKKWALLCGTLGP